MGCAMNAPRIQSAAAARVLGVSRRTVQELALRGELPGAARIGGVWTFDAERLTSFVKERERDAESVTISHVRSRRTPRAAVTLAPRLATRAQTNAAYERFMGRAH